MKEKNNSVGVVKTTPTTNKKKRLVVISLVTLIVILALLIIISKTNLRKLFSNVTGNIGYESREIEYNNEGKGIES